MEENIPSVQVPSPEPVNQPPVVSEAVPPIIPPQQVESSAAKMLSKLALVFLLLSLGGLGGFLLSKGNVFKKEVACTMEVKVCPDGSSVGRTGPNCEFSLCPTVTATPDVTANWKTYTDKDYGFSFSYPQSWVLKMEGKTGDETRVSLNMANGHILSVMVWRVTGFGYCYKYGDTKKIVVGGKDAETADGIGGTEMCDQPREVISKRGNTFVLIPLAIDNDKTLPPNQIHISYDYPLSDINLAKSNLNQILSTFKFTQ